MELCSSIPQTHTHTPTTCGTTLKKKTPRLQWHDNGFRFNFNGTKTTNHCYIHIFNIKFCCICSWAFVCKDNERTAKNMWIFHFVEMEEHKSMWLFIDDLISGLWVRIHTVCHRGENASVCPLVFIHFFRDTHYKDEAQVNPQRIQLTVHNIVSIKEQQPLCEYVAVLCVRVRTKTIAGFRLMFRRLCLIIYNCNEKARYLQAVPQKWLVRYCSIVRLLCPGKSHRIAELQHILIFNALEKSINVLHRFSHVSKSI